MNRLFDHEHAQALLTRYSGNYEEWLQDALIFAREKSNMWQQKCTFLTACRIADIDHEYSMAAYMLRDLPLTRQVRLSDLCQSMNLATASKGDFGGLRTIWDMEWIKAMKALDAQQKDLSTNE